MPFITDGKIQELEEIARQLRLTSLEMIHRRKAGHPGGCLSAADIVAALFFHKLRIDPRHRNWSDRDYFILSKGHASALLYAALARREFFPSEDLLSWGDLDCHLQGHPDRLKTPGVEMTTGLLGHGVAIGSGLALAARLNQKSQRVYVLLGDGECQAGMVWEGAMTAAKYNLSNLLAIVDYNDVQLDGPVHEIMPLEPFAEKWRAFNWAVLEINGHDMRQIVEALDAAEQIHAQPTVLIARTTKGRGVSYMENLAHWHGIPPDDAQMAQAVKELSLGEMVTC
jgi:transketolase